MHWAQDPMLQEQPETWGPEDGNATLLDFPEMLSLMALPGVDLSGFDQCELGAKTAKPPTPPS